MLTSSTSHQLNSCTKCGSSVESLAEFCATCGLAITAIEIHRSDQHSTLKLDDQAEVYLKRAWGLIKDVDKATETFRQRSIQHNAQIDQDQPFVAGMVGAFRGAGNLKREKTSLLGDLDLATSEIDKADAIDPGSVVHTEQGILSIIALRATSLYLRGQIEMIWGHPEQAKAIFLQAIQIAESPNPHYMLGLLNEDEYKPQEALKHFERCLELDPDGELSVPALREANSMKNYRKKFRGSWLLCLVMFVFFFPAAIIYFAVKYK